MVAIYGRGEFRTNIVLGEVKNNGIFFLCNICEIGNLNTENDTVKMLPLKHNRTIAFLSTKPRIKDM